MVLANLIQAQVVLPTWVGTVVAVSLAIIALSFVSIAIGALIAFKKSQEALKAMVHVVDDLKPAIGSFKEITEKGKDLVDVVRNEADAFARSGRRLRRRIRRGTDRVEERLQDLDALYEVVHEELEEAALSMATLVRTVRTGGGVLQRIRRFLPGRRRRR
jgi:methyl-accepting chemotaxis protein